VELGALGRRVHLRCTACGITYSEGPVTVAKFKVCTAPPGGCGAGRRKRVLTTAESCTTCGSDYRVTKNQKEPAR
jgi:hypothetical protein